MNDKLIDALFSVSTRLRELRGEMDKLVVDKLELTNLEDECDNDLVDDLNRFNSTPPSESSLKDTETPGEFHAPLMMSVTRSGKRRVMDPNSRHRVRAWETPPVLLSRRAIMRIKGAGRRCAGSPDNPIKLQCTQQGQ